MPQLVCIVCFKKKIITDLLYFPFSIYSTVKTLDMLVRNL